MSYLVANPEDRFSRDDQDQDSLLVKRRNDNHSPGRGSDKVGINVLLLTFENGILGIIYTLF